MLNMTQPVYDYTPYVQQIRQRAALRQQQTDQVYSQAWQTAHQIAHFLHQNYQPQRVILFGSLLFPQLFHLNSDIDIAVEGIPWPAYLRVWNDIEALFPQFKVDLIDISIVSSLMRQRIEAQGQLLTNE